MIDNKLLEEALGHLPRDVQIEIIENVARKEFTESELADIQQRLKEALSKHTHQGKRTDLEKNNTSVPKEIEVDNTLNKIGKIFGESKNTVHRRLTTFEEIKKKPKKYEKIKQKLDKGTLSISSAHTLVTREKRNLPKTPLPIGKWTVVQCDFARSFDNGGVRGGVDNNYDSMTLEQLTAGIFNGKDVRELFAKDCVLFGWMQASTIFDGKEILQSWGFEPVTNQVWDKTIPSTGTWLDNYHEHLVIARKGKIPIPALRVKSIVSVKPTSRVHSHKPPYFYDQIEQMYPKRKYLDLFSRYQHNTKWTTWGNQNIETEIANK